MVMLETSVPYSLSGASVLLDPISLVLPLPRPPLEAQGTTFTLHHILPPSHGPSFPFRLNLRAPPSPLSTLDFGVSGLSIGD